MLSLPPPVVVGTQETLAGYSRRCTSWRRGPTSYPAEVSCAGAAEAGTATRYSSDALATDDVRASSAPEVTLVLGPG
jgi:hypothetical protein